MYYVNTERIQESLDFIPQITSVCTHLLQEGAKRHDLTSSFAQERALHLAIELVTDVGHAIIDGFIMRDASSYEDIIEILQGEGVLSEELSAELIELIVQRKELVQKFTSMERNGIHSLLPRLTPVLEQFSFSITDYLEKELK